VPDEVEGEAEDYRRQPAESQQQPAFEDVREIERADESEGERSPYDAGLATDRDVMVYRISGAFFFGAASSVGAVLDNIASTHKAFVVDFAAVPFLDSTAANAMNRACSSSRNKR